MKTTGEVMGKEDTDTPEVTYREVAHRKFRGYGVQSQHQLQPWGDQSGRWTNIRKKIMLVTLGTIELEMLAAV